MSRLRGARIEIHDGPDSAGRYSYTLYWQTDYHPGHPAGEHGERERGQCFFADPRQHGLPQERIKDLRNHKGDSWKRKL